jgi:hypothetical protein
MYSYDDKYYANIFDAVKSNPYKIILIDPKIENYEEICKLAYDNYNSNNSNDIDDVN